MKVAALYVAAMGLCSLSSPVQGALLRGNDQDIVQGNPAVDPVFDEEPSDLQDAAAMVDQAQDDEGTVLQRKRHKKEEPEEDDFSKIVFHEKAFVDIDGIIQTPDRDMLAESTFVDQALVDAYNQIHAATGFNILDAETMSEYDMPTSSPPHSNDPPALGQERYWNKYLGRYMIRYNFDCRLCVPRGKPTPAIPKLPEVDPLDKCRYGFSELQQKIDCIVAFYRNRAAGLPPLAEAQYLIMDPKSSITPHRLFENLFCKMLRDSHLPQFDEVTDCHVHFIYGDDDEEPGIGMQAMA
jgi:hypothetical protein